MLDELDADVLFSDLRFFEILIRVGVTSLEYLTVVLRRRFFCFFARDAGFGKSI